MIEDALKYPFQDEKWIKKGLIGSLLTIGSLLIIPAFTLLGYLVRVMREESLPEFNNILDMTVEGFQASLIISIYIAAPLTLVSLFESSALGILGILFIMVVVYSIYSIIYQLANNGWKAAFSIKVFKNAFTLRYFLGFILATLISNLIGILYLLSLLFVVTIILLPLVYFYQYLISFRIMAEAVESD